MPRQLARGSFRRSVVRRATEWIGFVSTGEFQIAAPSTALVLGTISQVELADFVPFTLIRIRGWFSHRSDQAAASETYAGALGIAVVKEQARAVGGTSLPAPITDSGDDSWLYWTPFVGRIAVATSVGIVTELYTNLIIDNKAMRKIADGDAFVVTAETAALGAGVNGLFFVRMLFKLH